MADTLAIDDSGNALRLTDGKWTPAPVAVNDSGEKLAFDGETWKSLTAPPKTGLEKFKDAVAGAAAKGQKGADYVAAHAIQTASGLLGAPSDLSALGKQGADYVLAQILGPSKRVTPPDPSNPGEGPAPKFPTSEVMPGSADIQKAVFGATGVPNRNLADEPALTLTEPFGINGKINLGSAIDKGVNGAMSMAAGPGGMANLARNMTMGASGGVLGGLAGQAAHGTPYELPAEIAGNLVGGGATMLGQKIGEKSSSMLAPFTQGGKERIAQDVIGKVATDPKKAVSALDAYTGDAVPGVNQTAAKITADPGLLSMENYAYGSAGANQKLQGLVDANNAARTTHLDSLAKGDIGDFVGRLQDVDAGLAGDVKTALSALPPAATPAEAGLAIQQALGSHKEALSAARSKAVQPLYDEVAQWSAPVDARNARIAATDFVNTTKGELQGTARSARSNLYTAEGQPDNTAQGLVAARQDLAHKLSKPTTTDAEGHILQGIQGETDRALEESVPAARQARDTYRQMSVPLEPFSADKGPSVFNAINQRRPMDSALVPQSFLKPGQAGAAGIRGLSATGAPGVTEPMRGYVSGLVNGKPESAASILDRFAPGINELDPSLGPQIGAVAEKTAAQKAFGATPAGRMAGLSNPEKEIGAVLGSKDGPNQVATMLMHAGNDPEALAGLRKGIMDDFKRTIESRGGTDAENNQTLLSAKAKTWLESKGEAAGVALTPEQRTGMKALVDSLDVQSRTAPKMAGSDTVRNAMSGTFMGKMLSGNIGNIPVLKSILNTTKTQDEVVKIVADALADPVTAKAMLMKYNDANAKLAEPIFKRLLQSQAVLLPGESK